MSFTESKACRSGRHCHDCRALTVAGEAFRKNVGVEACPYGRPMGYGGSAPVDDHAAEGVGEQFHKLARHFEWMAVTGCSCNKLRATMNRLGPDGCHNQRAELIDAVRKNMLIGGSFIPSDLIGIVLGIAIRRARRAIREKEEAGKEATR